MANGWGGKRANSGRRTKAEILGLAKTLEECVSREDEKAIWAEIIKHAKKGSKQHAELYLAYKYGKPSEHIISESENETIVRVVRDAGNPNSAEETTSVPGEDC
jgi:hypothetical protein